MVLTPVITYESLSVRQEAYTETGAGDVGLQVDGQRHRRSQLGLGLRLGGTTQGLGGLVIKPELGVMVLRDSSVNHANSLSARYVGEGAAGTGFRTDLASLGDTTARMQLGLGVLMSKTSSLAVRYQRDQRSQFKADAAELMLRWDF
jgi:outer membrane autotransporter protein